jgi:hypothetical protein
MKHTLSTASLIALLCAAVILIFMALRPAHAQQWQLPNYGRDHGVVTEPGMPKCNMAVSEECRRLYGRTQKTAPVNRQTWGPTPGYECAGNFIRRNPRDPALARITSVMVSGRDPVTNASAAARAYPAEWASVRRRAAASCR